MPCPTPRLKHHTVSLADSTHGESALGSVQATGPVRSRAPARRKSLRLGLGLGLGAAVGAAWPLAASAQIDTL